MDITVINYITEICRECLHTLASSGTCTNTSSSPLNKIFNTFLKGKGKEKRALLDVNGV